MSASAAPARSPRGTDISCPLCGASDGTERFREPPYEVRVCAECDLTYVTPRLDGTELVEAVYDECYWNSPSPRERGYADYRGDEGLYLETFRRRRVVVERHLPQPGRALDVGCAAGYFLTVLAEAGWEVHGLEPSPPMHALASERLGPDRVTRGRLSPGAFPEASFDLVTLWDVLEHLPRPLEALGEVRRLLAPGGRAIVLTQNVSSPIARLLGRRWHHYKHAEHLMHFTPRTLRTACERVGMRVLELSPRRAGKVVRLDFAIERSARLAPWVARALAPLKRLGNPALYVNPLDEMIAVLAGA